ncbi:hypothetical protein [Eisenbergiella tayi]|nr:hypothetical protein [Eisenbergiella tayi]RJW34237.1 hypothetical protein DXC97_24490 [Lachnospiraceae bacterium TF09-5]
MKLSYIQKINQAAKYCGYMKQESYNKKDHNATFFYKNEQRKLYLLKALCIQYLIETGNLKMGKRLQDKNGTILESFVSVDGRYNFHSVSANQEFEENENPELYTGADDKNYEHSKFYLPFMKYLVTNLPEKYNKIYRIITEEYFYFDITSNSMENLDALKDLNVKGKIYNSYTPYDSENYIYLCNLFLNNIRICSVKVETDFDRNDTILTDESGFLEYDEYDRF